MIDDSKEDEIETIHKMERSEDTETFVIPYSLEKHREEFAKEDIRYKSIYDSKGSLIGFMILVLDPDDRSLEFRRIVISERGKGYGKRAVKLVDRISKEELDRSRLWLDVFDYNERGRHIYESNGYTAVGTSQFEGEKLCVYEKTV